MDGEGLAQGSKGPRITSYNVCYTKLLRISLIIFAGIVARMPAAVGNTIQMVSAGEMNVLFLVFRITSYNVCYTKLLRR